MSTTTLIAADVAAFYRCTGCGVRRKFGDAPPADAKYRPLIECRNCKKARRHEFIGMREYVQ